MADIVHAPAPRFQEAPSFLFFIFMTLVLIAIGWILSEFANYTEITSNWDKYRCSPSITPFSKFYGHNLEETMNFCIGEAVKENAPGVINPLYQGINAISTTVEGVYDRATAIQGGVVKLLGGFETFLMNFANSFRLIGTRIRISLVKIRDIFDRVYGMFISFAMAGISAITFGENLICNPIVTFIGTIAGVDVCCFAPDTLIVMSDGSSKMISQITIGDTLLDCRVTSVLIFNGMETDMVNIDGVIVSENHCLIGPNRSIIEAGKHPLAIPANNLPYIYCLNTTNNIIPVISDFSTLYFTDYDETSDPDVIQEAKMAATLVLNGDKTIDPCTDFSLGVDPTATILLDTGGISLFNIQIGNILRNGSTVCGIIVEECNQCVQTPAGIMSASQLVYNGRWVRAHTIYPTLPGTQRLVQLMLSDNQPFTITKDGKTLHVRDYMEVHDVSVQESYNRYLDLS
jgi:hypothetical protein